MINLENLNKTLGKQWKTEEEIDWVYVAKHMPADLDFMKENAAKLRPSFVVENPALLDERGIPGEKYNEWIMYYNEHVDEFRTKEDHKIIEYLNKRIENDPDFEEDAYLECEEEDTCVGFCGMDQGELYNGKIYLNNSDTIISIDDPWEETKATLLALYKRGCDSAGFWDLIDAIQDMSKEELLETLSHFRELTEEDKSKSEEELRDIISVEYDGCDDWDDETWEDGEEDSE